MADAATYWAGLRGDRRRYKKRSRGRPAAGLRGHDPGPLPLPALFWQHSAGEVANGQAMDLEWVLIVFAGSAGTITPAGSF